MSKFRSDAMCRTRASYIVEAAFEYFISLFVTGTLLGYILEALGFSDAQQGIILTVATFTCGAQLCAVFTSGKTVKRIVTVGHLINQLCFVLLYLLPTFEISQSVKATVFIVLLFAGHLLNNAVNPAKIAMYMNSVPDKSRGSFTAIKEMVSLAGGIAGFLATLAASLLLGSMRSKPSGHLTMFGVPVYAQQILSLISLVVVIVLIIYMCAVIAPMKRVDSGETLQSHTVEAEQQSK